MSRLQQTSYKSRAIVLHTMKYGDSAMIAHMLTEEFGRVSFMVQGARGKKGRTSKAALLQPLFCVEYIGVQSPMSELHRIKELSSGLTLTSIPFDVRRSTIALFVAELIYRIVRESESNLPLFDFLWSSVEALDTIEEGLANFHLYLLANLSSHLGFTPLGEWGSGSVIDIVEGAFTGYIPSHGNYIESGEAQIFYRLLNIDISELGDVKLNREQRVNFLESIIKYYGYHFDTIYEVQSVRILQEIF